jgi:hydroxypyruvate reductase
VILAVGTDGSDGPTEAAGAIVDGESAARARALGLDPAIRLAENDSGPVLARTGDRVMTGPTNTNLLDLYLLLVGPLMPEKQSRGHGTTVSLGYL